MKLAVERRDCQRQGALQMTGREPVAITRLCISDFHAVAVSLQHWPHTQGDLIHWLFLLPCTFWSI